MTTGTTGVSTSGFGSNFQFNPSQFGIAGLPNSGLFAGLGAIPLGGFGQTGTADGDFSNLFSSLQSSGTFGPGLYNSLGPSGSNPQAIALASEAATAGTSLLLNKLSPLGLPPEAMYSSSVFGSLNSGTSLFDTLSSFANGIAGTLPLSGSAARMLQAAGPAFGAVSGILGVLQGLRAYNNKPTVSLASSPDAVDDYIEESDA